MPRGPIQEGALTRRSVIAAVVGWSLACASGVPDPGPYRAEVTPPWSELQLPLSEGRVVYSDEAMITVHVDGGDVAGLTERWSQALTAAGLVLQADTSAADMTSITWADDTAVVALGILAVGDRAEVSLTRYPK